MVFEISDRDEPGGFGDKERRWTGLERRLKPRRREAVANFGVLELEPALLFVGRQVFRNDIEQETRHTGVRKVRRDARSHRPRPEHDNFADFSRLPPSTLVAEFPSIMGAARQKGQGDAKRNSRKVVGLAAEGFIAWAPFRGRY